MADGQSSTRVQIWCFTMSIHVSPLRKDSLDDKWMPVSWSVQVLRLPVATGDKSNILHRGVVSLTGSKAYHVGYYHPYTCVPITHTPVSLSPIYTCAPITDTPVSLSPIYTCAPITHTPVSLSPIYTCVPITDTPVSLSPIHLCPYHPYTCVSITHTPVSPIPHTCNPNIFTPILGTPVSLSA